MNRNAKSKSAFAMMDRALIVIDAALRELSGYPAGTGTHLFQERDFTGDENAIAELSALSQEAKAFLGHHIMNTLSATIGFCELRRPQDAVEAAYQLADILRAIGCNVKGRRKS